MSHLNRRLLFWSPRILCIAFAVFLSLFATDVLSEQHGFLKTAVALLIHLIPVYIVLAVLLAAWQWEWVGAVLFTAAAATYAVWALPRHPDWTAFISLPLLVIAALFLAGWTKRADLHAAH